MANEAVIIELGVNAGKPVRRTVASATGISGGTICKLTDPNTAAAGTAFADVYAGIAAGDKSATDGAIDHGFYTEGVFDIKIGDIVTAGQAVSMSGSNVLRAAIASDFISGCFVGVSEETTSVNEVARVRLRGY